MILGKRVKKLLQQNKHTLNEISYILGESIEKCVKSYENYYNAPIPPSILIVGNERKIKHLKRLIDNGEKILLYGDNGVGKSSAVRSLSEKYRTVVSYAEKTDQLIKDFGDLPFKKNYLFVLEAERFYWRGYALLKKYLKDSNAPFIVIVNNKKEVHKSILDLLTPVRFTPPSKQDIEKFLKKKFPDWKGNIDNVYNKDFRVLLRKVMFDINEDDRRNEEEHLDSKALAYKILVGKVTPKDIENAKEPLPWTARYLGYNVVNFFYKKKGREFMDLLCFYDLNKYNFRQDFLKGVLLSLPKREKRGRLYFPPFPPKKKKEEIKLEHNKNVKVEVKKPKIKTASDMII